MNERPTQAEKATSSPAAASRARVLIENVSPLLDGGRSPIKRLVGDTVEVSADIFGDGHDVVAAAVWYGQLVRPELDRPSTAAEKYGAHAVAERREVPLVPVGQDVFRGAFTVDTLGTCIYGIEAWIDPFATWCRSFGRRIEADQDVSLEVAIGESLIREAAARAPEQIAVRLEHWATALAALHRSSTLTASAFAAWRDPDRLAEVSAFGPRHFRTTCEPCLEVQVERERAVFSAWYELFPRSAAEDPARHGTLRDVIERLDYVRALGFDVLYLPPIHPIGVLHRKGKNGVPRAASGDEGSPWAIGAKEGGHTAIHPALGTDQDFTALVEAARARNLELALDLAFQCAPDHPWVKEHPEWFKKRPDGSIQYAENPPKKYQDIYPLDFETDAHGALWRALYEVVEYWVRRGVQIFRVDNPHTKPFRFWAWLIREIRVRHPEVIFLAEAFTRPKVMYALAKCGFSQSYTYFAWKNTKRELTEYFGELGRPPVTEFFRPNVWPNTPDILNAYLQFGGPPAFAARAVLAATLSPSYGVYGPPFENAEGRPREPGSEEYLDSEKYQRRSWDFDPERPIARLLARLNRIREESQALRRHGAPFFHPTDNDQIIAYSKRTEDEATLVVVNLDPHYAQSGWVDLSLAALGLEPDRSFQVHDLLTDARYLWNGPRNFVQLDPATGPGHVFRVRKKVRTEHDFEYFV